MKFKYALLVAVGLACFNNHAFAEETLSQEQLESVKQKANAGDIDLQRELGIVYQFGKMGVQKDPFEAKEWYEKAVKQGDTDAMINLGNMYQNGDGVPQDYAKAKELLETAANKGVAMAQYNMGIMYEYGKGIPKNYTKAIEWYKKAANQGDGDSYNKLGIQYKYGKDVPKNDTKAKEYFKQACLHKSMDGCDNYKLLNNR